MLPVSTKKLTEELARLGAEVHTIMGDGTQVTRDEALADLIWKYALGWTEQVRDKNGNLQESVHTPVAWAMQYIYERREGKSPAALPDSTPGMKATDKVRTLVKERLNALVGTKKAAPPIHKPK